MQCPRMLGAIVFAGVWQLAWAAQPSPQVVLVQPSATVAPANLLRLSVVFAAPVEGAVLPRIALLRADGSPLQEPFLPQELWSPDGKVLTLLLHPGRVKTGLVARELWGPIFSEGDDVVLTFDGRPIKRWHIGAVDPDGPVTSAWKLSSVDAGSRQALVVTLDGPIDGRDVDDLAVVGTDEHRLEGRAQLRDGETTWTFTPDVAWGAGDYRLIVHGTLEDPSGNRLGGHFETPESSPQPVATDGVIAFKVARRQPH